MVCYAVQHNLPQSAEGTSGLRPDCVATSVGSFIGELSMECKNGRCPLFTVSLIPLTQGKFAIVDCRDYAWLMQWKWYVVRGTVTWYAQRKQRHRGKQRAMWMHRLIAATPKELQTDHINHNGLDNRRGNLRPCTRSQNQHNRLNTKHKDGVAYSKYKGVRRQDTKWQAMITVKGKAIRIGRFPSEIEAAKAYDQKAIELFGEFARPNFAL